MAAKQNRFAISRIIYICIYFQIENRYLKLNFHLTTLIFAVFHLNNAALMKKTLKDLKNLKKF